MSPPCSGRARRVLIVNTHGGHNAALTVAAERAKRELGNPLVAPVYAYTLIASASREVRGEEAIGHPGGDQLRADGEDRRGGWRVAAGDDGPAGRIRGHR